MKKTIKPFDLEAAKNGAKVETRDGRPVRILDYNIAGNPYSIVGAVPEHPIGPPSFCNPEEVRTWTKEGMNRNDLVESPQDLVIVEYESEEQKEKVNPKEDRVGHPSHYTSHPSGVECIDITRHYCFDIGNAIKYLWRAGLKKEEGISDGDKEIEDLEKAIWYIKDHIESLKKQNK